MDKRTLEFLNKMMALSNAEDECSIGEKILHNKKAF